jgi:hyperosmotically inducible protein
VLPNGPHAVQQAFFGFVHDKQCLTRLAMYMQTFLKAICMTTTSKTTGLLSAAVIAAALFGSSVSATAADGTAMSPSAAASKAEGAVSDSWITTKVKSEILANSVSKAFKVGVKTKHGAVALHGKLPNQDAIDLVKMIAEKVKGVKSVDTSALVIA